MTMPAMTKTLLLAAALLMGVACNESTSPLPTVTLPTPARLAFTVQPSTTDVAQPITPAVQVAIQDAFANTVTSATNAVTLAIATNPGSGTLAGTRTVNALGGMAAFSGLSIDKAGTDYTLAATSVMLAGATSAAFDVTLPLMFGAVNAGGYHTCGVTTAGAAYCWGANDAGQLGDADRKSVV